jgi:hypothetical protein
LFLVEKYKKKTLNISAKISADFSFKISARIFANFYIRNFASAKLPASANLDTPKNIRVIAT